MFPRERMMVQKLRQFFKIIPCRATIYRFKRKQQQCGYGENWYRFDMDSRFYCDLEFSDTFPDTLVKGNLFWAKESKLRDRFDTFESIALILKSIGECIEISDANTENSFQKIPLLPSLQHWKAWIHFFLSNASVQILFLLQNLQKAK